MNRVETLKDLKLKGYKYIARDCYGSLYAYRKLPFKLEFVWISKGVSLFLILDFDLDIVEWFDPVPFEIDTLINFYTRWEETE